MMIRRVLPLFVFLIAACKLEAPEDTTLAVAALLDVDTVKDHKTKSRCVAAWAVLAGPEVSEAVVPVTSAQEAVNVIERGGLLSLQVRGRTPNELSQALTTLDMARGIGLIEPFTGARPCMSDAVMVLTDRLVNSPGALLVYDTQAHSVVLADTDVLRAVYLRISR